VKAVRLFGVLLLTALIVMPFFASADPPETWCIADDEGGCHDNQNQCSNNSAPPHIIYRCVVQGTCSCQLQ
jgi:hypothetical protein